MMNALNSFVLGADVVSLQDLFTQGGTLVIVLFFCSAVAIGVIIERFIKLQQLTIDFDKFIKALRALINEDNIDGAIKLCDETAGPIPYICKAALLKHDRSREEIKDAILDASVHEIPKLEKHLGILATIAYVAPLIGLLGTVVGMIQSFRSISENIDPGAQAAASPLLVRGIWEALITTAVGLTVAIPTYVAYSYFASRVEGIISDMERAGTDLVNILCDKNRS